MENHLLLKTFLLSVLIHLAGISLFSMVLPPLRPEKPPIEVSLLPPASSPRQREELAAEVLPEIPLALHRGYETVDYVRERETLTFALQPFTGFPEPVPSVKFTPEFEIPEFEIEFPDIAEYLFVDEPGREDVNGLEIEGPAGDRRLRYRTEIDYPVWARQQGIEGNIRIRFWVSPDGVVARTELLVSSGSPELDSHADNNLRRWIFEPVSSDSDAWGVITFRFRLT